MPPQTVNAGVVDSPATTYKKYTMEEIQQHSKSKDCWIVLDNKVYDVTSWAPRHPGGPVIHSYGGADASLHFRAFHPPSSKVDTLLKKYLIGEVESYEQTPLMKDFTELQKRMEKSGVFTPDLRFYLGMTAQIMAFFLVSWYILAAYEGRYSLYVAGLLFAMTQIQAMWIAHDFGHLSVFEKRKDNVFVHTLVHGCFMGASGEWWRRQHNRHHASPNRVMYDPDVNTFPFFAWDEKMARMSMKVNKHLKYQAWYWQPMGPIIHRILYTYHWTMFAINKMNTFELGCMASHYLFVYGIPLMTRGLWETVIYIFIGYAVWTTTYLWIVAFNHFPMHIYHSPAEDFVTQQVRTTQNIQPGAVMNWFTGHLSMQIEHHLFPRMPRHNYMVARGEVMKLCKKHGLDYRSRTVMQGFGDVYGALSAAAKTVMAPAKKTAKAE